MCAEADNLPRIPLHPPSSLWQVGHSFFKYKIKPITPTTATMAPMAGQVGTRKASDTQQKWYSTAKEAEYSKKEKGFTSSITLIFHRISCFIGSYSYYEKPRAINLLQLPFFFKGFYEAVFLFLSRQQ